MIEDSNNGRLLSLDFFRGAIMVLLMLESAGLYHSLWEIWPNRLLEQFFHHPWHGLRFWDLIQPGFMFIAGTGMALSLAKQSAQGISWLNSFKKMLARCGWLFFWGVLNYAVRPEGLSFELWNVLTQLSATLLIAFLIYHWQVQYQFLFSIALLLATELLYRFTALPGFDQPFVDQHNFGNFIDLVLMGKVNSDGWVALNFLPTAAHTIWGAIAGKWILDVSQQASKVKLLALAGLVCLISGYLLDATFTPIIKRISTSSFVLASGGWCWLALAVCYWWIDILRRQKHLTFFIVVSMNSIFIYLFFEIVGAHWFNGYINSLVNGIFDFLSIPDKVGMVCASLIIFMLEWGLCWFLYKRKIFFKL
jgi:predicted acyltransferase